MLSRTASAPVTDLEWLGLMMSWSAAKLRDQATSDDLTRLEAVLGAAANAGAPLGWDNLRRRLQLSRTEQTTLSLLIAVELSLEISALVAKLNGDHNRPAIDVALLQRVVYSDPDAAPRFVGELSSSGALHRYRLVETVTERRADEAPFLLRQLRPTRRVIELVHGMNGLDSELNTIARLIIDPKPFDNLRLSEDVKQRLAQLAESFDRPARPGDASPVLVLAGSEGSGRRSLLEGIAKRLDRTCLIIDCARLPTDPALLASTCRTLIRESLLTNSLPVLHGVDALGPDATRPDRLRIVDDNFVEMIPGVVAATGPRGDTKPAAFDRGLVLVDVDPPREEDRKALWKRELGDAARDEDAAWAAARYTVTGGVIKRAAHSALAEARARREPLHRSDVHAGVRSALDAKLATVARRITITQTWADIVLPTDVLDEVSEIIARVEHRDLVYEKWGLAKKIGKGLGLSALFSGPPGTGKTMIAGVIVSELGLDLYRVDLSQVVSKYIGETEKNLAGLFDAAEAGHALLLFDEADSMFAKRTEVKTSNDRYANLEVNFLLQRMETFTGISILTTNLESSIDEAFKRRLSFRIAFPLPEEDEREKIWRTMLPPGAKLADDLDLSRLAERFEMSGGYIKNAVVRAAFIAADRDEPLGDAHLMKAAALEYAAMGKVMHSSK